MYSSTAYIITKTFTITERALTISEHRIIRVHGLTCYNAVRQTECKVL